MKKIKTTIPPKTILIIIILLLAGCSPSVENGLTYDQYINKIEQYRNNDDYDRAIEACKKALEIKPTDGDTHCLLATLYDEAYRKSFNAAQKKQLQDLFQNPSKKRSQHPMEEYKKYGLKAELKDLALQEYRETLKYSPDNWLARYLLATDHFNRKQYSKAIEEDKRVIEINPRYSNAYSLMGEAYYELGDYPAAIQSLQAAIQIDPADEYAHYQLGRAYRAINNGEKVMEIMQKLKNMHSLYYDKLRLSIFERK